MNSAAEILKNVDECISELEKTCTVVYGWRTYYKRFKIRDVCDKLSIFDWWDEYLSYSQLLSMHEFLETAIKYGYTGYVCFKVGASGCSHGMWAHKAESDTDSAPDGEYLFHSFRHEDNYWVICFGDGTESRDLNKRDLKKVMANLDAFRMAEKKRLQELDGQIVEGLSAIHDILTEIHGALKESKKEE